MKRPLIVAVHGILTGNTGPTWPWRLAARISAEIPGAVVAPFSYHAGPFPFWNTHVRNPRAARNLAATVRTFDPREFVLHFIGHSNGCHIIALSLPLLANDFEIGAVMLVAAAMPRDVRRTPIGNAALRPKVRRIVAVCSKHDDALKVADFTFYGPALGRWGFYRGDAEVHGDPWLQSAWLNGYDHSAYWSETHFGTTRQIFYDAAGLTPKS